jgi:hypothetical protein
MESTKTDKTEKVDYTTSTVSKNVPYLVVCKGASEKEEIFNKFKSTPEYCDVLEHVNEWLGGEYIKFIKEHYPKLLDPELVEKFKGNDKYGGPTTFTYPETGSISPTTLRYMKVLGDLETQIDGLKSLDGLDIVEIGCGYGGQCRIISEKCDFKSYTFIDLPVVIDLIEKCIKQKPGLIDKCRFVRVGIDSMEVKGDLVISNYAFSECDVDVRKNYINTILNKCTRGYLTINYLNEAEKKELCDALTIPDRYGKILYERPSTADANIILVW